MVFQYLKCGVINILSQAQGSCLVFLECKRPLELDGTRSTLQSVSPDKSSDVSAGSLVFHSRYIVYLQQGQNRAAKRKQRHRESEESSFMGVNSKNIKPNIIIGSLNVSYKINYIILGLFHYFDIVKHYIKRLLQMNDCRLQ